MKEIFAVINQKGGVGKSTTALALAAGLTARGFRTLLIDLDAQGNLTYSAGAETDGRTAFDMLSDMDAGGAILTRASYDLIPADSGLATADLVFAATGKEYRLREALEPLLPRYDYIVLDTPPALGILTVNALTTATAAIIPAQADIYSLQGIGQLYSTLEAIRKYTNPSLSVRGILLTRYNPRSILTRDMSELLEETADRLGTRVFDAKIREAVAVREAQAAREDIFTYAPKSNATQDYAAFIDELLTR